MSDAEWTFPQWQGPLQELILEFDPQRLPEKIPSVETLVLERLHQLDHGNDSRVEKIGVYSEFGPSCNREKPNERQN